MSDQSAGEADERTRHASALHDFACEYEEGHGQQREGVEGVVEALGEEQVGKVTHIQADEHGRAHGDAYMEAQKEQNDEGKENGDDGGIHVSSPKS